MPMVPTIELLNAAAEAGYGVGAFNVIGLEHAQAITMGAEQAQAPVILQVSQNAVRYQLGSLQALGRACTCLAESARVPVALHLDHATDWDLCEEALDLGFGSVMLDASQLPFEENVTFTKRIAEQVHRRGKTIEAELGVVGGKDGAITTDEGNTDPELARSYVEATGIDALAVAVGTSHYMVDYTADVDLNLVSRLRRALSVPLVLHGSSGVPPETLREAVHRGIVKVNTATELNKAYTRAVRRYLVTHEDAVDPRPYLSEAREQMAAAVAERMHVIGSAGRA